jgi:hypothetical protein
LIRVITLLTTLPRVFPKIGNPHWQWVLWILDIKKASQWHKMCSK